LVHVSVFCVCVKITVSRRTAIKTSSCAKSQDLIEQELPVIDFRTKAQSITALSAFNFFQLCENWCNLRF